MLKFSFNNPPIDNIAFLMSKKPQVDFDRSEIYQSAHQRAFTIARIANIDLLADIQTSLENAFVEGQTYDEWIKELKPTLQKAGWFGKSIEVINPKTKEKEFIEVGASRLKKIFYTNAKTAYQQSRAREQFSQNNSDEYLRYVAILDNRTRHTHAQMHGLILKKSNDFWKRNYPPNGWNCRCRVDSYSKEDLEEFGFKESTNARVLNIAHKDWDYDTRNLNRDDEDLQLIIDKKLKKLAHNKSAVEALNALKVEIKAQRQRYNDMRELWNSEDLKKTATLCALNDFVKEKLGTKANKISISARMMHEHKNPNRTRTNTHLEISPFEYSIIPFMLDESRILGIFRDKNNDKNIYIVASKLNHTYRLALADKGDKMSVASLLSDELSKEDILGKLKRNKQTIYLRKSDVR